MTEPMSPSDPVLWDGRGKPLSLEGAMIAPAALNVAQVIQLAGKLYSYRWDEAMRDAPQNALAMKRDTFYLALLQERWAPTMNLEWQVEVDNPRDPKQKIVADGLQRLWAGTPDKTNLIGWLLWAEWYGRSAQQGAWGKQDGGLTGWVQHEPVNGDGIQYQWDGTPVVLVSYHTAQRYLTTDPAAVIRSSDRGAYGIRLYKPEYRRRFIIHTHQREAADYFEGEMSGGVHGVGLRSWLYWGDFIKRDSLEAMLGFMRSTGMMDLIVFNFPEHNDEAKQSAIANAKKISGKIAVVCPRDPSKDWPAIEQYSMNTAGIEVMKNLIYDVYDRYAERLIVGQSMSGGADHSDGLGGTGRAELAGDTKYNLCKLSANRLGESLTRDYLVPARDYNFPWAKSISVRLVPVLKDPDADKKVANGQILIQAGIEIEEEDFRSAAGYATPRPGAKTVGGKPAVPGGDVATGGRAATREEADEESGASLANLYGFDPSEPRDESGRWTAGDANTPAVSGENNTPTKEPPQQQRVSIPGHDRERDRLPSPDGVTGVPKTKKAREKLAKDVKYALIEARNAFVEKYGTRNINDRMSELENQLHSHIFFATEVIITGRERDGTHDLGPVSDSRYAGYYRGIVQAIDKLRAEALKRDTVNYGRPEDREADGKFAPKGTGDQTGHKDGRAGGPDDAGITSHDNAASHKKYMEAIGKHQPRTLRQRMALAVDHASEIDKHSVAAEVIHHGLLPAGATNKASEQVGFDFEATLSDVTGKSDHEGVLLDDTKTSAQTKKPYYYDKTIHKQGKATDYLKKRDTGQPCVPAYLVFHASGIYRCFGFDARQEVTIQADQVANSVDEFRKKVAARPPGGPMPVMKVADWPADSGTDLQSKIAGMQDWSHNQHKKLETLSNGAITVIADKLDDLQDEFDDQAKTVAKKTTREFAAVRPQEAFEAIAGDTVDEQRKWLQEKLAGLDKK